MSLLVAGAALGEVQVLLFLAGAALGEVQVSLFVAGAAFGEFLNESRGAKRCILQKKNASVFFCSDCRSSSWHGRSTDLELLESR